ncbi:hypothetical protein SNEBB_003689 [Seison nebaliae]|nr:hypothetical protein SNEBB_003689 [Seison nebaliae]
MIEQPCYTIINCKLDSGTTANENDLRRDLESSDIAVKTKTLKMVIQMILMGEKFSQNLLMTVIRFVMPCPNNYIKKLLLYFWEVVPKHSPDGKLLHEMILVCDAYRKDLQHPNEFIRGATLRFLCKLQESDLLEPLMPSIIQCLQHRHSYVRRNAVLAISTIYQNFDNLIPDAADIIYNYLLDEQDMSCRRNAFMMLIYKDQEKALQYLSSCVDQVIQFGDILQLVIVELIYKVCHANPSERSRFIRIIYNLLQSAKSASVRYEAANTLVTLSSAPAAIRAAVSEYIDICVKEADNNVKLIVLDRLMKLSKVQVHEKVMQELLMDIVRILNAPDLEVRRRTLDLALVLVSSRNVSELAGVLKREVLKASQQSTEKQDEIDKYSQLLVRTLHQCCIKFPDVAITIVPVLIELLTAKDLAATDVLIFVREAINRFPKLRGRIIGKLLDILPLIKSARIFRGSVWILSEFASTPDDFQMVMTLVRQSLGDLPIVEDELNYSAEQANEDAIITGEETVGQQPQVTADGTYATQSAFINSKSTDSSKKAAERNRPLLRAKLMEGEFFIGASICASLTKLSLRFRSIEKETNDNWRATTNRFIAETMFIIASMLHLGKTNLPKKPITDDDAHRMGTCIKILSTQCEMTSEIFLTECREALANMIDSKQKKTVTPNDSANPNDNEDDGFYSDNYFSDETNEGDGDNGDKYDSSEVSVDEPIQFIQSSDYGERENIFDFTLKQAIGLLEKPATTPNALMSSSKLSKVIQLTGFADAIYAEAYVNINQYDIILDVLLVNQTNDTLQSLTLELATVGDLKLVEKPQPLTLGPHDFTNLKANLKVACTENGTLFGRITYDVGASGNDHNIVVLNDIHIDIMDYIIPASCSDVEFRSMWLEFEWENKVTVNTNINGLQHFLSHLLRSTNMRCLTPKSALSGECGFLAANLYAKSIFGEHVLVNVSIENPYQAVILAGGISGNMKPPVNLVQGHIRIRAKSQGMALSVGDRINNVQKLNASQLQQLQLNKIAEKKVNELTDELTEMKVIEDDNYHSDD